MKAHSDTPPYQSPAGVSAIGAAPESPAESAPACEGERPPPPSPESASDVAPPSPPDAEPASEPPPHDAQASDTSRRLLATPARNADRIRTFSHANEFNTDHGYAGISRDARARSHPPDDGHYSFGISFGMLRNLGGVYPCVRDFARGCAVAELAFR